ncbi:DUF2330 domain-containing protein [Paraliomyxa miuraensis]|uniref:DUF2330 domain-containing protein n=1 Tax=Paraliomyxa miuraensis TaxID=376150 RepID=UPI002255EBBA|nr:DUF2330 domain-containing protein [Paraliomyxa miuraensis]MCX4242805.1 DUF2330 domain-containing protein [Paraliomyxa miuraensis]
MRIPAAVLSGAAAVGLAVAMLSAPRPAEACGGTFCDTGPGSMPVDQTGETILFVVEEGYIEAHIQIQYDPNTNAEQFAWVVPVTALPEFSVGSQQLFLDMLEATVPTYDYDSWREPCNFGDSGNGGEDGWDGCDGTGAGGDGGDDGAHLDAASFPDDPEVVLKTTVGAFEVFVLDGGTVQGVMQWLGDNGFAQDPAAEPILAEYLAEGHLFVAFRLQQEADVAEIHPIVLRYAGVEPCVPIRLTRIAAQEDMEIRALFLADSRVSSSNWRHVTLNLLRLDWPLSGTNYRELVTMAVDEPGANGHAFVTEYAGPSSVVSGADLVGPLWDSAPFATASTPAEAAQLLCDQVLYDLADAGGAQHPLVEGLVERYLPAGPTRSPDTMCEGPVSYGDTAAAFDPLAWDGPAFAADLEARVIAPSRHAQDLLESFGYLTRLYTTLSPIEMTEDPMFHLTPDLPEQTTLSWRGSGYRFCDGAETFELPDGRLVALPLGVFGWPQIAPEQMPWVETIEYLPAAGAPVVEVDHRDAIAALLEAWNTEHGPPRTPTSASCHGGTGSGATDTAGAGDEGGGKGCGCRSEGAAGPGGAVMLGGLLVGYRRRRRRR